MKTIARWKHHIALSPIRKAHQAQQNKTPPSKGYVVCYNKQYCWLVTKIRCENHMNGKCIYPLNKCLSC